MSLEQLGTRASETATIGDRLDTDIEGGRRAGLRTILVLTGVTTRADADAAQSTPDWVFENLNALREILD
jgi:4-nitrophenyl phosphatase